MTHRVTVSPLASRVRAVGRYVVAFYMIHLGVLAGLCGLVEWALRRVAPRRGEPTAPPTVSPEAARKPDGR